MVMSNQTLWVTLGPFLASTCSPLPSSTITRIKVAAHPITFIMGCFRSVCKTEKARVEKLPPREEADRAAGQGRAGRGQEGAQGDPQGLV